MAKDPEVGSLYGPYVVQGVIARGGQGVVLRTIHSQHNVQVALKLLFDNSEISRRRFLREIETLRDLQHPRLPRAFDLGEHEGTLFIALELIEGKSLSDLVKTGGILPVARAVEIVLDVARTVAYCHSKGVFHRDLKPANVIIHAENQEPYVVDFGIVKIEGKGVSEESRLSLTGEMMGTPAFMAPEQADGEAIGPPADIYGLGAILYYLICGQKPFDGATAFNTLSKLIQSPTPDVRSANPEVPAILAEFLLRAMAKEPAERPQTALAFVGELDQALRAPPPVEVSTRPRWLLPLMAGSAALLVAGLLVTLLFRGGPPPHAASPNASLEASPSASLEASPSASLEADSQTPAEGSRPWVSAPLGAPGTPRWTYSPGPGREFVESGLHALGPYLVAKHAPRNPAGSLDMSRVEAARLTHSDGGYDGGAPSADHWCWDSRRKRSLYVFGDDLFGTSSGGVSPSWLAKTTGVRGLGSGPQGIYILRRRSLEVLSIRGKHVGGLSFQGISERPPLLLDLDPRTPGLDRLLVTTSDSELYLLDLEGVSLDVLALEAPCAFTPTFLRGSKEGRSAEVVLTSGAGVVIRVEVSPKRLRLLRSARIRKGAELVGPVLVDRSPAGEIRNLYVAERHQLLCLDPELKSVTWGVDLPGLGSRDSLRGAELVDLNRDGAPEVLATFISRTANASPHTLQALFDSRGRIRFVTRSQSGRGAVALLGGDSAVVQVGEELLAWGPWSGLPAPLNAASVRTPPRPLSPLAQLKLSEEAASPLVLKKGNLPPFELRFAREKATGPGGGVTHGEGVLSVDALKSEVGGKRKNLLGRGSRYEISFQIPQDAARLSLEIETKVLESQGPGFAEVMIVVDGRLRPRTRQLRLGQNKERFQLGQLSQGPKTVKVAVSSRSHLKVRILGARLVLSDE